ncbi:MAG TPA: alanine racemase [Acidimicrobiales bacterium]|jgi:alanine racemase|nr:alanine racemase [Acidimicrobiales bacterium]
MAEGRSRPAWAEVDLAAVRHNVRLLRQVAAPAALCAVVKADGYGHGAPIVARATIEGGATSLAVALVDEGVELRDAGFTEPVLLLSEPPVDAVDAVVAARLTPTVATEGSVRALAAAARQAGVRLPVHVKVDTGMHRVGADPADVPSLVKAVQAEPDLELEGLWTHLAVADGVGEEDRSFTGAQLRRFDAAVAASGPRPPVLHAANSAATIAWPEARYDLVRCGIAVYGELPSPALAGRLEAATGGSLRPALSLRARVAAVRRLDASERPSYGRLRPLPDRSVVATVPLGYADGVPRALFGAGFSVLIGGRRRPLAGMVTMDQIVVDCGPDATVAVGDEVTLLGSQGDDAITADDWASLLGTIGYEILCGIGPRVPRVYTEDGRPSGPAAGASPAEPAVGEP